METQPMSALHDIVTAVRDDLNRCLLERHTAVDNALLALLSGEHFLQLGPSGAGKSRLVRAISHRLVDTNYFEILLTPFSVPEEVFGPLDLVGYAEHGQYRRVTRGSLSEAHVAFVDEVFKANSAILQSLLTIINERIRHEVGSAPQPVPLLSLFAASNETPVDSSLMAFDNRFKIRQVVEYLHEESSFISLVTGHVQDITDVQATLSLDELAAAQQEVRRVQGSTEVLQALVTLKQQLSQEGIVVTDSTWGKIGSIMKARAWLDGVDTLDVESLACLAHVLWIDPKHAKPVQRLVYQMACPLVLKAVEVEDEATEVFTKCPPDGAHGATNALENVLQQLTDQGNRLKKDILASKERKKDRAMQALHTIGVMHKAVATRLFKLQSDLTLNTNLDV